MTQPALARRLGLFDATMLVMGGIIGSGIFLNPAEVARHVSTPALIVGAIADITDRKGAEDALGERMAVAAMMEVSRSSRRSICRKAHTTLSTSGRAADRRPSQCVSLRLRRG